MSPTEHVPRGHLSGGQTTEARPASMAEAFDRNAQSAPEKLCLRFEDEDWSYGRLRWRAGAFAAALGSWGLQPGDRIALFLGNHPDFLAAYLGAHLAGGVVVPVNRSYRRAGAAPHLRRRRSATLRHGRGGAPRARAGAGRPPGPGEGGGARRGPRHLPGRRRERRACDAARRGPRPDRLHLGDDGPEQGRDAAAPQPARQRRSHLRSLEVDGRGSPPAHPAPVPLARPHGRRARHAPHRG